MTRQLQTDTLADRRKRKFSFFANALLKKEKNKKELPPLNFLSGFLCPASFSTFAAYIFLCVGKFTHKKILAMPPAAKELNSVRKTKTPAKKFSIAPASWTVACILTAFFTVDCIAQQPQTPQPGTFTPVTPGQSYPAQNNNYNQQNSRQTTPSYPMGANANDIIEQSFRAAEQRMGTYINRPYLTPEQNQKAMQAYQMQQIKNQPGYGNPSAENNFNQMTPEMKTQREMEEIFNELNSYDYEMSEAEYLASPKYLNDFPNYSKAKETMKQMLEGTKKLSIKDAYYLSEAAYGNLQLSYNEYNKVIAENANFTIQWLAENGYNPKDPEALHLGIQKFLSDTLYIKNPESPMSGKAHYPYSYDYIDAPATEDHRNYFVTKTLATGTGQCHTLPVTYLVLAEALGLQVYLSYNPQHSFIQYKNDKGVLVNYETTVDRFLPDQFYLETLPKMAKAKKNKIYINSLNKKQIVATVMLDLAVNFVKEHQLSNKKFIKECINTAAPYFPEKDYINTSHAYLNKRLLADTFNKKVREKGINKPEELEKYPDVVEAYNNFRNYVEKIDNLGIQDFPESEYIRMMKYYDTKGKLQVAKNINAKQKKNLFFNY